MKKESRASPQAAFHRDAAAMGFEESITHGKPQASATFLLCRKKRLKNMRQGFRMNALTGVGYRDSQIIGRFSGRSDGQNPAGRHRIHRIEKEIDQNLFQRLRIAVMAGRSSGIRISTETWNLSK